MQDDIVEPIILNAAFAGLDDQVRTLLASDPAVSRRSIYAAAALSDADGVLSMLDADATLVNAGGGKWNWPPLLYLCCSRYRRGDKDATDARLRIAKRLLEMGADINAAGLELGYTAPHINQMFDEWEWRPIDGAAGRLGNPELVRLLLE